jgi:hypothetical protein
MRQSTHLHNDQGSVVLIAVIILVVLTVIGIAATNTTDIELKIVQNTNLYKKNFYHTESGGLEVAYDVDKAGGGTCPSSGDADYRLSCLPDYAPSNPLEAEFLTAPVTTTPTAAEIKDYANTGWPANYPETADEYGYRVYYRGTGSPVKGFDASKYTAFIYDISTRKQTTTSGTVGNMTTVIRQGFRKMGPSAGINF